MLRLVQYMTTKEDKYQADRVVVEVLGTGKSIWHLWYQLNECKFNKHIEVFSVRTGDLVDMTNKGGSHGYQNATSNDGMDAR